MYTLDNYEKALRHFGIQVEYACASEISGKISAEEAYQRIKYALKQLKEVRKSEAGTE